jgi:predicted patatin/cPLA2 family phospholipase
LPSFNGSVHVYTTIIDGLSVKPLLIDHFHDANDFADAIKASCFLPLICGLSLYTNFRGNKCIDGGVTMPVPYKN